MFVDNDCSVRIFAYAARYTSTITARNDGTTACYSCSPVICYRLPYRHRHLILPTVPPAVGNPPPVDLPVRRTHAFHQYLLPPLSLSRLLYNIYILHVTVTHFIQPLDWFSSVVVNTFTGIAERLRRNCVRCNDAALTRRAVPQFVAQQRARF